MIFVVSRVYLVVSTQLCPNRGHGWFSGLFQGITSPRELDCSLVIVAARHFLSIQTDGKSAEDKLVASVIQLFNLWNQVFNQGKEIYIDYERPYFINGSILTKYAGIVQIKDYAKEFNHTKLLGAWRDVQKIAQDG